MKAAEVLRLLRVTRPTLSKYVREGIIKTETMPNGQYNYSDSDVYKFLNGGHSRQTVIYVKASGRNRKKIVDEQANALSQFCFSRGYSVSAIYRDTMDGNKEDFDKLLNMVIMGNIEKVVILDPTVISSGDFALVKKLFNKFNTDIVTMTDISAPKELDSASMYNELVAIFKSYSPKLSSKRSLRQLKNLIEDAFDEEA